MAYCGKCGSEIKPGSRFCQNCGAPVSPGPSQSEPSYQSRDTYRQQTDSGRTYRNQTGSATPVQQMIKEFGGSILFIVFTAVVVINIIVTIANSGSGGGFAILGAIPSILMAIGLIMFFVDCRGSHPVPKGSGIGVYKAGKIVTLVMILIVAGILAVALIMGGYAMSNLGLSLGGLEDLFSSYGGSSGYGGYGGYSDFGYYASAAAGAVTGVIIAVLIIIAVIIILAILLQVKLMKTANLVRESLASGRPAGIIPVYPPVIMIILTVLMCIGGFFLIGSGSYYGSGSPIAIFIFSAIQMILGAVLLLQLRKRMFMIR